MKVTGLELDNFQSYDSESLEFDEGVSLLHGDNGSGKSTILRGIFAGLFQTDMGRHAASDFDSIGELVRKGEEEGRVELTFEVDGEAYTLTWVITVDDPDAEEPTGSTKECMLDGPALDNPVDGVTSVSEVVQEEILGMDAQAFTNSVYVQQNEVMKLITADESEREEIFDDLLGLSKLDEYIDRTVELRRAAKAKRDEVAAQRDEVQSQLDEQYPERDELVERQQEVAEDLDAAETERDDAQERVERLEGEYDDAESRLDKYDDLQEERDDLQAAIEDVNEDIETAQQRLDELDEVLDEQRERKWSLKSDLNDLDDQVEEYDVTDAEAAEAAKEELEDAYVERSRAETKAQQSLESAEEDLEDAEEALAEVESALEDAREREAEAEADRDAAADKRDDAAEALDDAIGERDGLVDEFLDDPPDDVTPDTYAAVEEHIASLDDDREEIRCEAARRDGERTTLMEVVQWLDAWLDGADVSDDADEVDASLRSKKAEFEDRIEELADDIVSLEEEVEMYAEQVEFGRETVVEAFETVERRRDDLEAAEEALAEAEDHLAEVRSEREDLEADVEEAREQVEDAEDAVSSAEASLAGAESAVDAVEGDRDVLKEAVETHNALADCKQTIESKETEQEDKREMLQTLRNQRGEKQARLEEVEDELAEADPEDIRETLLDIEDDLQEARQERDDAQERVDDLNGTLAKVENKIDSYDGLVERRDVLEETRQEANEYVEEMNDLIGAYETVKSRLRKENIALINGYANEVFRELYHSEAYERLILNEDYTIALLKSDGSRISPKLSSGGEAAIVNIALRAGVYRTIAEREQTDGVGLPPFILDEPTTFLDDGHIQELERVIESIKDWNVEQVVVVSHDEALIDSADHEYAVTKDSATDTSTCERQSPM